MVEGMSPVPDRAAQPDFSRHSEEEWNALPPTQKDLWARYLKIDLERGGFAEVDKDNAWVRAVDDGTYREWLDLTHRFGTSPGFPPGMTVGTRDTPHPPSELDSVKTASDFTRLFDIPLPGENPERTSSRKLPDGKIQIARFFSKPKEGQSPVKVLSKVHDIDGAEFVLRGRSRDRSQDKSFRWRKDAARWELMTGANAATGSAGTADATAGGARTDAVPPRPPDPPPQPDPIRTPDPRPADDPPPGADDVDAKLARLAQLKDQLRQKTEELAAQIKASEAVQAWRTETLETLMALKIGPMSDLVMISGKLKDPLARDTLRNTLAAFPEDIPPPGASEEEKLAAIDGNERRFRIMQQFAEEEFALYQHGERAIGVESLQAIMRSRLELQDKSWQERVGLSQAMTYAGYAASAGMLLAALATLTISAPFTATATPLAIAGIVAGGKAGLLKHRWDTHNLIGKGKHIWHKNPTMWAAVIGGIAGSSVLAGTIPAVRQSLGAIVESVSGGAQGLGTILKRLTMLRSAV